MRRPRAGRDVSGSAASATGGRERIRTPRLWTARRCACSRGLLDSFLLGGRLLRRQVDELVAFLR